MWTSVLSFPVIEGDSGSLLLAEKIGSEYSWVCSEHFVTGVKSNDPLAPHYIPTAFKHICSPVKCNLENRAADFNRRQETENRNYKQTTVGNRSKSKEITGTSGREETT